MMTATELSKMIDGYNKKVRPSFDKVLFYLNDEFNEEQKTGNYDDDFIRHIVKGWKKGESADKEKRIHSHQNRMPGNSLKKGIERLNNFFIVFKPNEVTFEDLYDDVKRRFAGIYFCQGPLTVYDVALRIGNMYGIEPKVYVYLCSGAMKGAKRLLGKSNLPYRVPVSMFPAPLCNEPSMYIEDMLCTFKDVFLPKSDKDYKNIDHILGLDSKCRCLKPHSGCH